MPDDTGPKPTILGKLVIVAVIAACGFLAWRFLWPQAQTSGGTATASPPARDGQVRITLAYGSEKERWLKWAVEEFARSDAGRGVAVTLEKRGSIEAGQGLLAGTLQAHLWAPASALAADAFAAEWELKNGRKPALSSETLALTPVVFVFWDERYRALAGAKAPDSFRAIGQALAEPTGWAGLANHPEWGFLKFGHAHPNQSNSGQMALILMAYAYHGCRELGMAQVLDAGFQQWLTAFEKSVTGLGGSTGDQMKDMVLKGPSAYDGLCAYESVAIDYLRNAQGRWGDLRVVYPNPTMWADNPCLVLDAPWSSPEQRAASGRLLAFLMSEPVQRQSLVHGFRPGNPAVPVNGPDSPFTVFAKQGLRIDLPAMAATPKPEVVQNLMAGWQRAVGR